MGEFMLQRLGAAHFDYVMFPRANGQATPGALHRLQKDYQKLLTEPVPGIHALPSEANILEWHYVIEGSPDTPYIGGFYHGKIVFQPDFPWKPPAICMVTPNGRFRINVRLCLSISDYHPETWNPGWTVSSILIGLQSFMNEDGVAAGVLNETVETKKKFAEDSIKFNLGNPEFCKMFPQLTERLKEMVRPTIPPSNWNHVLIRNLGKRESNSNLDAPVIKKTVDIIDLTDDD